MSGHRVPVASLGTKRGLSLTLIITLSLAFLAFALFVLFAGGKAFAYDDSRALILVDEPSPAGIYPPPESTLANLLGHFDIEADIRPVDAYLQGEIDSYRVTFYLGNVWDHPLPADFLSDVVVTSRQVVWINCNLWSLDWGELGPAFESRYGISLTQVLPTGDFTGVTYKGRNYTRSQDIFSQASILDPQKATAAAFVTDGQTSHPYILRSGNFFFVVDNPLDQTAEESPFLVFADQLHEMVLIDHPANHQALVRIEDVGPEDDPARIRAIADYLYAQEVPFTLAVTPEFADPLGATGPPRHVTLAERPALVDSLKYATERGGTIIMHGVTHQYDSQANPYNGVSGLDCEFVLQSMDAGGNILSVSPIPEDSAAWISGRLTAGRAMFTDAGLDPPYIWETPHYLASDLDRAVFASQFDVSYERFANTYFPYVINRTVYGNRLIPENLGYITPGVTSPQLIINRAARNLAVRDGFASFFFHPEVEIAYLQSTVAGIKAKGYTFADSRELSDVTPPAVSYAGPVVPVSNRDPVISATYMDPSPSSGIETDSATVRLDTGELIACSATEGVISCPVVGLEDRRFSVEITIRDRAGNTGTASGEFMVDTVAPAITSVSPAGTVGTVPTELGAEYSDSAGCGVDTRTVSFTLDGVPVGGITADSTSARCSAPAMGQGEHELRVSVADLAGNTGTRSGTFTVMSCSREPPDLVLGDAVPFWGSFMEYRDGVLSVRYVVRNRSVFDAFAFTVTGVDSTQGVALAGNLPPAAAIPAAECASFTIVYHIPTGVTHFRSSISATARDACGNEFSYPASGL